MIAAGAVPLEPFVRASVPWPCRCTSCGNTVAPTLAHVQAGQGACRRCAHRLGPEVAAERIRGVGLEPLEPYPGSHAPWRSMCTVCEAELAVRYANVVTRGQPGCPRCAAVPGREDVAVQVMRAAGLEPLTPYPGANLPWHSRCLGCACESTPRYANVRRGRSCRYCAATGVDHRAPAAVCVVGRAERCLVGIGLAAWPPPRLADGWRTSVAVPLATGADAFTVQQAVLQRWRRDGVTAVPSVGNEPSGAGMVSFATTDASVARACADLADVADRLQRLRSANRRTP